METKARLNKEQLLSINLLIMHYGKMCDVHGIDSKQAKESIGLLKDYLNQDVLLTRID